MRKTLRRRVAQLEIDREVERMRLAHVFEVMEAACEAAGIPVIRDEDELTGQTVPRAELRLVQ